MIYVSLSGCITFMSGHFGKSSFIHKTGPDVGFMPEKVDAPMHFMFDKDDLFTPPITQCFRSEPIHPVNCKIRDRSINVHIS